MAAKVISGYPDLAVCVMVSKILSEPVIFLEIRMDADDITHYQELSITLKKRLRILEMQEAEMGMQCPPHILLEIDDTRARLADITAKLRQNKFDISQIDGKASVRVEHIVADVEGLGVDTFQQMAFVGKQMLRWVGLIATGFIPIAGLVGFVFGGVFWSILGPSSRVIWILNGALWVSLSSIAFFSGVLVEIISIQRKRFSLNLFFQVVSSRKKQVMIRALQGAGIGVLLGGIDMPGHMIIGIILGAYLFGFFGLLLALICGCALGFLIGLSIVRSKSNSYRY